MNNNNLSNVLSGGYWGINKSSVRVFGVEKAVWMAVLYDWRGMLMEQNNLPEDDFFFITQEYIYDQTGIAPDKQSNFIKYFEELKILQKERRGCPAKNFYKIDSIKMIEYIDERLKEIANDLPRYRKMRELDTAKCGINNNKEIILSTSNEVEMVADATSPAADNSIVSNSPVKINRGKINPDILTIEEFLIFPGHTKEAKEIMLFWNSLPSPLIKHTLNPKTKQFHKALDAIEFALNMGNSAKDIKKAIFHYQMLLSMPYSKINNGFYGVVVGLPDFFRPIKTAVENLKKIGINITSWFDECSLNWGDLQERYSKEYKDKRPDITEALTNTWPGEKRFTLRDKNILRKTAERTYNYFVGLKDFKKDNSHNNKLPYTCVNFIWRFLKEKKDYDFKSIPYWIQGEQFFTDDLTPFLKEIGYIVPGWDSSNQPSRFKTKVPADSNGALSAADFL